MGVPYIKKLWKLLSPLTFGRNKAYAQEVLVLETHSLTYCMVISLVEVATYINIE